MPEPTLTRDQLRTFYDKLGAGQDDAAYFEAPALRKVLEHGRFKQARAVFELGCGTGRLARQIVERLPETATYTGVDLSETMVALTKDKLEPFSERAHVHQTNGALSFDLSGGEVDRFVATYVLDLLPETAIRQVVAEAYRVLEPGGLLCLTSLSYSTLPLARLRMGVWQLGYRLNPKWLGGCRPLKLLEYLSEKQWRTSFHATVVPYATPSEIVVARKLA